MGCPDYWLHESMLCVFYQFPTWHSLRAQIQVRLESNQNQIFQVAPGKSVGWCAAFLIPPHPGWSWELEIPSAITWSSVGRRNYVRKWYRCPLLPALMMCLHPCLWVRSLLSGASMAHTGNWFMNWERKLCRSPLYHLGGITSRRKFLLWGTFNYLPLGFKSHYMKHCLAFYQYKANLHFTCIWNTLKG